MVYILSSSLSLHQYNNVYNTHHCTHQICFRIGTVWTQDKLLDEAIQKALEFACIMRSVHYVALVFEVKLSLSAQLTAKEFCGILNER